MIDTRMRRFQVVVSWSRKKLLVGTGSEVEHACATTSTHGLKPLLLKSTLPMVIPLPCSEGVGQEEGGSALPLANAVAARV